MEWHMSCMWESLRTSRIPAVRSWNGLGKLVKMSPKLSTQLLRSDTNSLWHDNWSKLYSSCNTARATQSVKKTRNTSNPRGIWQQKKIDLCINARCHLLMPNTPFILSFNDTDLFGTDCWMGKRTSHDKIKTIMSWNKFETNYITTVFKHISLPAWETRFLRTWWASIPGRWRTYLATYIWQKKLIGPKSTIWSVYAQEFKCKFLRTILRLDFFLFITDHS